MPAFSDDSELRKQFDATLKRAHRQQSQKITRADRRAREELQGRIEETRSALDQRHIEWDQNREYAEGDGQVDKYIEGLPVDLQSEFTYVNFIRGIVDHFAASLIAGIGDWYVISDTGDQDEQSTELQRYLEACGHQLNLHTVKRELARDAFTIGTGVAKVWWNKQKQQVAVDHIDPITLFPEANAKTLDQAFFVAERHVYNVDYFHKLYPDADLTEVSDAGPTPFDDGSESWVTRQIELWEVLYEFGAKMMLFSGNEILYTGPAPFPSEYPYRLFRLYHDPKSLWGVPLLKDVEPLQDFYNRFITRLAIYMHLCIQPVGHTDDQEAHDNWDNTPGTIIKHGPNAELGYLQPPGIPRDLFALGQSTKENMDTVSSITEVTRGERPAGVTSGIAVDLLGERSDRRVALPGAEWNHNWSSLGQLMLDFVERFTIRSQSLPFVSGGAPGMATVDRQFLGWSPDPGQEARKYHVVAQPGAQIALSPAAIAEQAMQAFTVGAFDDVGLLEAMKLPGRREYLERKNQQLQAMLQGQMDGMMAGVPTGAPDGMNPQMQMM